MASGWLIPSLPEEIKSGLCGWRRKTGKMEVGVRALPPPGSGQAGQWLDLE
jgi:hypothetical protein